MTGGYGLGGRTRGKGSVYRNALTEKATNCDIITQLCDIVSRNLE